MEYTPTGVCARKITFDLDEEQRVHNVKFELGCNGNLKAIGKLIEGMSAEQVIRTLEGNTCKTRPTSCADQLAQALKQAIA